jgi:hypothetical protein
MFIVPFVFMMLLAASFVAISIMQSQLVTVLGQEPSAVQPIQTGSQILATQQQQQPQLPQLPAATATTTATTQSPNQGQMLRPEAGLPAKLTQLSEEDMLLADRIFPYLIQKMDAKTLQTLIQKVDGKILAAKILPHLQVRVGASAAYAPNVEVNKDVAAPDSYHKTSVMCPTGTSVFGGGGHVRDTHFNDPRYDAADNQIVESGVGNRGGWMITAKMDSSGSLYGYALCGRATLELVQ